MGCWAIGLSVYWVVGLFVYWPWVSNIDPVQSNLHFFIDIDLVCLYRYIDFFNIRSEVTFSLKILFFIGFHIDFLY